MQECLELYLKGKQLKEKLQKLVNYYKYHFEIPRLLMLPISKVANCKPL